MLPEFCRTQLYAVLICTANLDKFNGRNAN